MRDLAPLFAALGRSRFRSRFKLGSYELKYLEEKGWTVIAEHARKFVQERLGAAQPRNDGKQTPMKGHPAFIAQHATATCCRNCLEKWHGIGKGKPLTAQQIDEIVQVMIRWLEQQTM